MLTAALLSAQLAGAQCPGPEPQFPDDANQNPSYLQLCYEFPTPCGCCTTAGTPSVENVQAQEATLVATIPTGFTADEVHWAAYYVDDQGFLVELWNHRSTEGAPHTAGTTVRFGASGLLEGREHRFSTSYCGTNTSGYNGCFCWSALSDPVTTSGFPGSPPTEIDVGAQEIEDRFTRPVTMGKESGGDGLGPDPAWMDALASVVDGQDAGTDGDSVQMLQAGAATRMKVLDHAHAYADTLVRTIRAPGILGTGVDDYNIDVFARAFVEPDNTGKGYYIKLAKDPNVADGDRALLVGRLAGDREEFHTQKLADITGQPDCPTTAALPLESADPIETGRSLPVWVRIEVADNLGTGEPLITGYVAWDCDTGDAIEQCGSVCKVGPIEDLEGSANNLFRKQGASGFCSHHKTHFFDEFRAGSTATP